MSDNIIISKGGNVPPRKVGGSPHSTTDRSFAQPNPLKPIEEVKPKAHASEQEALDALNKNSTQGRKYNEDETEIDPQD